MRTKNISVLIITLLLLIGSGCTKLAEYNKNPNATTEAPASALLTNVEAGLGGYAFQAVPGLYCQYFSETQYTDASSYSIQTYSFSGTYSSNLEDMQNIIDNSGNNNMTQVARIIKDFIFWTITDRVGDIPYTGTLKGGNGLVPYDTQETVYKALIADLAEAASSFDDGASVITGDVIFGGNTASWIKVANSLHMLMALQLSKTYPGAGDYAATEFKAAMNANGGIIVTNADNFVIDYPGDNSSTKNPVYNVYDGRKDYGESKTMTDMLSSMSDSRINVYGGITESSTDQTSVSSSNGFPYGLTRDDATAFSNSNPDWARVLIGDFRQASSPLNIITAAQVNLAIAEAIDRGWVSGSLSNYYKAGIIASFAQWDLPVPSDSYFSQASVSLSGSGGTSANIKQIATQRYIATYPDGLQGWNLWRRTGYPQLTPSANATNTSGEIPRRYQYGTTEYSSNQANTEAAAAAIGGDTQDTHVWWDK